MSSIHSDDGVSASENQDQEDSDSNSEVKVNDSIKASDPTVMIG
mgnify:CR=1 FL=1